MTRHLNKERDKMEHDIIPCRNGHWMCKCGASGLNRKSRMVHEKEMENVQIKEIEKVLAC
jgi:hypothetical protein